MMLFQERQQIVILCLAGAMVSGFVLFRYLPLRKRIKAVEQTRTAQGLAAAEAQRQNEQLPILKEQLLELQRAVGNYEQQVPCRRELGMFLQRIANLMNEHNLKEQLVQPGEEMEIADSGQRIADSKKLNAIRYTLNAIPVSIRCKGRLTQIFEFYKSLQGLDRRVRIEQVKLENDSDFSGEVRSQTKVVIYYRPEAGQEG